MQTLLNNPAFIALAPVAAFVVIAALLFAFGKLLMRVPAVETVTNRPGIKDRQPLIFGPITHAFAGIIPDIFGQAPNIDRDLARAGFYRPFARVEYLAVRNMLVTSAVLLTAAWALATQDQGRIVTARVVLAGFIITILCFALPRLYVRGLGTRRIRRIEAGLPDALDIISMCITGGLPLQAALDRVPEGIAFAHSDLAFELDIVRRQSAARSLEQALRHLTERIDNPEVDALASLVSHADELGTDIGGALRDYADAMRRNHRQRAEERGNKMSVKMLFPIVVCLAPAAYLVMMAPSLVEVRNFVLRENRPGGAFGPIDLSAPTTVNPPAAPGTPGTTTP
jgi:tight adherence protein C